MHAKQTEKRTLQACSNFVGVCNSAKITRDETVNVLKFNAAKAKANISSRQRVEYREEPDTRTIIGKLAQKDTEPVEIT